MNIHARITLGVALIRAMSLDLVSLMFDYNDKYDQRLTLLFLDLIDSVVDFVVDSVVDSVVDFVVDFVVVILWSSSDGTNPYVKHADNTATTALANKVAPPTKNTSQQPELRLSRCDGCARTYVEGCFGCWTRSIDCSVLKYFFGNRSTFLNDSSNNNLTLLFFAWSLVHVVLCFHCCHCFLCVFRSEEAALSNRQLRRCLYSRKCVYCSKKCFALCAAERNREHAMRCIFFKDKVLSYPTDFTPL